MRRHTKPVVVPVGDELFVIRLGQPGKPRIYRRIGTTERRIADDDPVLLEVARAFKEGVDADKAKRAAHLEHKQTLRYRLLAWWGGRWARVCLFFRRGVDAVTKGPRALD